MLHPLVLNDIVGVISAFESQKKEDACTAILFPLSLKDLEVFQVTPSQGYIHIVHRPDLQKKELTKEAQIYDVVILNEQGKVSARLKGLSMVLLDRKRAHSAKKESSNEQTKKIKRIFAEALKIDKGHLDEDVSIDRLGVDSLLLMEILQRISNEYKLELKASDFVGLSTIKDFVIYLNSRFEISAKELNVEESRRSVRHKSGKNSIKAIKTGQSESENKFWQNYQYAFSSCNDFKVFFLKSTQNINAEVISCGKGESLIFLPPIESTATAWIHQIRALSRNFHIIVFNYPGYGRSEYSYKYSHLDYISENLLGITRLLHIRYPFHMVGWSMGGMVAQIFSERYPRKIKSLTLVNTTAYLGEEDSIENTYRLAKLLEKDFYAHLSRKDQTKREASLEFIKATSNNEISLHYYEKILKFDFRNQIDRIKTPTLIVAGGMDKISSPKHARFMHEAMRNSQYRELKTGGHYIPLQNPRYFNKTLKQFIQANK